MTATYYFFSFIFLGSVGFFIDLSSNPRAHKPTDINLERLKDFAGITPSPDVKRYYAGIDRKTPKLKIVDQSVDTRVVDGWFDKRLITVLLLIDQFQTKNNISGNLAEIGVWQGRSFIPLMHCAKADEYAAAIDCFESYEFNRDNSGGFCNFKPFMNNITQFCSQPDKLKIIKGDSFKLTHTDYLNAMGNGKGFRIFSVDGCHEAATTAMDMENVCKCLVDGGVIIMDDYFSPGWPGVSEGVNAFMNNNVNVVKPFLITMNKIFFSQPEYAKQYHDAIKNFFPPQDVVTKKFFDVETLIYNPKN